MASLAIIVALMFLSVLTIGPACYILSSFDWMPKIIVYILSILTIFIGVWWLLLPIPSIRYLGLLPIYLGYLSIRNKTNATIRDNNN